MQHTGNTTTGWVQCLIPIVDGDPKFSIIIKHVWNTTLLLCNNTCKSSE